MRMTLCLCLSLLSMASAFAPPGAFSTTTTTSSSTTSATSPTSLSAIDPDTLHSTIDQSLMLAGNIRDVAIFKGKTLSLLHPAMMFGMLGFSLSTALLGFNWRRQRTLGDEISALKKQLPKDMNGAKTLAEAIANLEEGADASKFKAALPIEEEVNALQAERKQLASEGPRDKHFSQGALLAFIGTFFAIEGPLNTYARAGKLFPGPHLYAGAGLVILWAMAASTVPAMQKGSDTARSIHIGANVAGIGLFGWQVVSGVPILLKVWEKAPWP